ncbi:MAG: hypothetical protein Aurels2KO_11650 [Aureliella sp.]
MHTKISYAWNLPRGGICAPLLLAISGLLAGCDRTDEIAKQSKTSDAPPMRFVSTDASAKQLIDQVARTYAQASSYRDRAYVRLLYTLDGQPVEDRAPLEIAFNRPAAEQHNANRRSPGLGMRVYSASAGPSSDAARWHFQCDNAQNNVPVVVSRKIPSRITAGWLLSDPWITENLSAGLVGFPLQLKLLLQPPEQGGASVSRIAGTVLQVLATQGKLRSPVSVDGHLCETVVASANGGTMAAWIDQETKLLRRVQFPRSALPQQMLSDSRISDIQLTIEFVAAEIDSRVDVSRYSPKFDPDSLYLTKHVAPPPSIDLRALGRRTPAFFLEAPSNRVVLQSSEKNRDGKILVLAWLANHPAAQVAAKQLRAVERRLQTEAPEVAQKVEFVSVWAEPSPPPGDSFSSLPDTWQLPGSLTIDRRAMGRDLFDVEEAPTVVVLDSQNRVQARIERGNPILDQLMLDMLQRLATGEDIAASTLLQASQAQSRYAAALNQNVAPDNVAPLPSRPRDYLPLTMALQRKSRRELDNTIIATAPAGNAGSWVLDDQGTLQLFSTAGPVQRKVRTSSNLPATTRLCGGSNQTVAIILPDGRGQILDFASANEPRVTEFNAGFAVQTSKWISFNKQDKPDLALMASNRLAIVDPTSGKQLEAPIPGKAIDLVSSSTVLLSDGRLEPLQSSVDQPATTKHGRLPFSPLEGHWETVSFRSSAASHRLTLGKVLLAAEEPAVLLLDDKSSPVWHHRLPSSQSSPSSMICGCSLDNACVFALAQPDGTVNFVRTIPTPAGTKQTSIQVIADSFRLPEDLIAVDLLPHSGEPQTVTLRAFHTSDFVEYKLSW